MTHHVFKTNYLKHFIINILIKYYKFAVAEKLKHTHRQVTAQNNLLDSFLVEIT